MSQHSSIPTKDQCTEDEDQLGERVEVGAKHGLDAASSRWFAEGKVKELDN